MKIVGLLTAWASEDWIQYSIEQALELVDELIISIGPYNEYYKKIKDKTLILAKKYENYKNVKIMGSVCKTNNTRKKNRCETLNEMLKLSENIEEGNLIWILDCDEFYSEEAKEEIFNFIEENEDFEGIKFADRFFCLNFDYYIPALHYRIKKIKSKNPYFTPTQKLNPRPKKISILLKDNPMFHYSMLVGEPLRVILWLLDDEYDRCLWYKKIYQKYNPQNEEFYWKKNKKITGNYGFWHTQENVRGQSIKGILKYNGKHPKLIENSHLKKITDFTAYYRKKENYKAYLKVMKKIINEKKTFNLKVLIKEIKASKVWNNCFRKIKNVLKRNNHIQSLFQIINRRIFPARKSNPEL